MVMALLNSPMFRHKADDGLAVVVHAAQHVN